MITMLSGSLTGPVARAIGWALFHLLWQGFLVAGLLGATLALMRRRSANARYLVSCAAMLALLILGVTTAVRTYDPASGEVPVAQSSATIHPSISPYVSADYPANENSAPATIFARAGAAAAPYLPAIVMIWAAGVLLLSVRLLFGWIRAHELAKRNAVPAAGNWERAASRLAEALKLRRAVTLFESAAVEVPTVIGFLRPVILLPMATLSGLSTDQIEMILAHELAHIRRHDFLVNLFQAVIETLLFYHPAVWWISRRIRIEREHCCDDMAVAVCGNRLQYARALTRFEELRVDPAHVVIAANGGSLLSRIRRLISDPAESPNDPSRWVAGAALLTVLAALLIAPTIPMLGSSQHVDNAQTAPPPAPKAPHDDVTVTADKADDPAVEPGDESDGDNDADVAPVPEPPEPPEVETDQPADKGSCHVIGSGKQRSVDELIAMSVAGVTPQYIDQMRDAHLGELTDRDVIAMANTGVTPSYLAQMREAGCEIGSARMLISLSANGVTPDYVRHLRAEGLDVKSARDVISLSANGITLEWIASMKSAGLTGLSAKQMISLRANGVDSQFVAAMGEAGYRNLSEHDLISLATNGVTPKFIKSLVAAGYTNLSVHDLIRLADNGVDGDFVRDLQKYKTNK